MAERIVITGWGQVTQAKDATPPYLEPVDMMERAAREAGALSGEGIWSLVDTILVVRSLSRNLHGPGEAIARRLGLKPRHVRVSGIGGETPQHFVNQAAGMLVRGEAQAVLICGAETYYPRASDHVRGEGAIIQGIPADYDPDDAVGSDALEQRHGLTLPIHDSCFPSAVTVAMGELGLTDDNPRPLTQTGGMGFFGGPGNNYALHGIASLAENIAAGKLRNGMATGLGWLIHKYAIGIYSALPCDRDLKSDDQEDLQTPEVGDGPVPRVEAASGFGTIETYTVIYARDQSAETGLVYGTTETGLRFIANSPADAATFARLTGENLIGTRVRLSHDAARGINIAAFVD